ASVQFEGYELIQGNHVQDSPDVGIYTKSFWYFIDVLDNTFRRCPIGLKSPTRGYVRGNEFAECGDGYVGADEKTGFIDVTGNRMERCGRGIYIGARDNTNQVEDNIVLLSRGDGITAVGYIIGNTVVGSGGTGITRPSTLSGSYDSGHHSTIERNVSAFNAQF